VGDRELRHRYIEVAYTLPDGNTYFRAYVLEARTPNEAAERAVANTRREKSDATDVAEFMQRTLTPERARGIIAQIRAGTWEGWKFG
jgi:hypothetical protein